MSALFKMFQRNCSVILKSVWSLDRGEKLCPSFTLTSISLQLLLSAGIQGILQGLGAKWWLPIKDWPQNNTAAFHAVLPLTFADVYPSEITAILGCWYFEVLIEDVKFTNVLFSMLFPVYRNVIMEQCILLSSSMTLDEESTLALT